MFYFQTYGLLCILFKITVEILILILRWVVLLHLFFTVICHFVDGPSSQFVSFPISWYVADNFNSILLHLIEMGFLFITNTNLIFQNNYNVFHYAAWMKPIYIMYFYLTSPVCIIFTFCHDTSINILCS